MSPAWRFRSGSRLGRRTPRNGTLPAHDLHRMGREACCRHDMAYLVSWRRVTHLQRSLRWGNASRFESSRPAILITAILQNRVYIQFRRLFRPSHRTCDPSSKWAVRGTAKLRQTAGEPGHAHARRVARSAEHLGGRRRSAVGGRRSAGGGRRAASRLFADSVSPQVVGHRAACCHFQFQNTKHDTKIAPPGNIRG